MRLGKPTSPFWDNVEVQLSGCWLWTGGVTSMGYGRWWTGYSDYLAHVYAYEAYYGTIVPKGYDVHHKCRTRLCICPLHTGRVPHSCHPDGGQAANQNSRKTHCKRGHELNYANTYSYKEGRHRRLCKRVLYKLKKERKHASHQLRPEQGNSVRPNVNSPGR